MDADSYKPKVLRPMPRGISAKLEATGSGTLRVSYGGTFWHFKILVSMDQLIQLVPGQLVTIVAVEGTTTLIIEV